MLDFNNNDTYTKEVVLKNVRLALFNRNALPDDALCAEFLDMSVVFALIEDSIPYRAKYKIIDATDMASLDIHVKEIMDAANENSKRIGYDIMSMEDSVAELTGKKSPRKAICPIYVGTNPERILGSSILLHETYLEKFAEQIEDDLCIAPANIHEVFIYPFSHVQPSKVIELVQNLNQTAVDQHETLSNSAYIYRRGTHAITQIKPKNSDNSHCEQNDPE